MVPGKPSETRACTEPCKKLSNVEQKWTVKQKETVSVDEFACRGLSNIILRLEKAALTEFPP